VSGNPARIAVALSGGIDSLAAAFLLLRQGREVIGLHFRTGHESYPAEQSRERAARLSRMLGVPVHFEDLSGDFERIVVDYFIAGYRSGETPNPCVVCNPRIKFGVLLERARRHGAELLATGHYAAVRRDPAGRWRLFKGRDPAKDQSYFLFALGQEQLARACFPLAEMTKGEVSLLAARHGLEPVEPRESQDVCFVPGGDYTALLRRYDEAILRPGPIATADGRVIGEHPGLAAFTIGQRRGIDCPAAFPYYVLRKERDGNRLIVGPRSELYAAACRVSAVNWIAPRPEAPIAARVRVRYRSPETPARILPCGIGAASVEVVFEAPQPAIAPGQAAVFYRDDEVLGGGFIQAAPKDPGI